MIVVYSETAKKQLSKLDRKIARQITSYKEVYR